VIRIRARAPRLESLQAVFFPANSHAPVGMNRRAARIDFPPVDREGFDILDVVARWRLVLTYQPRNRAGVAAREGAVTSVSLGREAFAAR